MQEKSNCGRSAGTLYSAHHTREAEKCRRQSCWTTRVVGTRAIADSSRLSTSQELRAFHSTELEVTNLLIQSNFPHVQKQAIITRLVSESSFFFCSVFAKFLCPPKVNFIWVPESSSIGLCAVEFSEKSSTKLAECRFKRVDGLFMRR